MRLLAALLFAILGSALAAGGARADGDPASDYLVGQTIFLPYGARVPPRQARTLAAAVRSANAQGFNVRVALIWERSDLGSVTALWMKPRSYARFLGSEIGLYFEGRTLVVMPNGIGLYWHGHSTAAGYEVLASVSVTPTPAGMAEAATAAIEGLAGVSGVKVSTATEGVLVPKSAPNGKPDDRIVIAVGALGGLALVAATLVLERRAPRQRTRPPNGR